MSSLLDQRKTFSQENMPTESQIEVETLGAKKVEKSAKSPFDELRERIYQSPQSFTVLKMAQSMNYSGTWFGILYKNKYGISPVKDRELALCMKIKEALKDENKTLEMIAEELGMSSASYLTRFFKRIAGVSPSEYKKGITR